MSVEYNFPNILAAVENSSLNYLINKTPFSATISLKSSFVKHYSEAHSESKVEICPDKTKYLKSEQSLKIIALEDVVEQQTRAIEEKCMEGKIAKLSAKNKVAEFREEGLMVISEKGKLEDKMRILEADNHKLRLNKRHTMRDNNQFRENIKETGNTLKLKES